MLVPLMTNQFVPPVEPLVTIPITARMEAPKSTHDGEVLFEMTREVCIAAESLVAALVRAKDAYCPNGTLEGEKKKDSPFSGRHARRHVCMNLATERGIGYCLVRHFKSCVGEKGVCRTSED
jgi:hypothetical protein